MTPSRAGYGLGDVVLVRFIYSDETGSTRRPAVVLSSDEYHRGRREAIVSAITSNVQQVLVGDHLITAWREAGLLHPSVATGIIRTIKRGMIDRRLGRIAQPDMQAIQAQMRSILDL